MSLRRRLAPALAASLAVLALPAAAEAHLLSAGPVTPPQLGIVALGLAAALSGWLLLRRGRERFRRAAYALLALGCAAVVVGPDVLASFVSPAAAPPPARIVMVAPLEGQVLDGGELHVAFGLLVASPSGWTPVGSLRGRGRIRVLLDGRLAGTTTGFSLVLPVSRGPHLVRVEYLGGAGRPFSPSVAAARAFTVRGNATPAARPAEEPRGAGESGPVVAPPLRASDWSWDPLVVAGLVSTVAGYAWAARRFRLQRWQPLWFWSGFAALAAALVSPVEAGASRLFAIHMVQHMLLLLVAPPLLALAAPPALLGRLYQIPAAARVLRTVWAPIPAVVLYNGVLLLWHLPALYDATLRVAWVHALQHVSFMAVGLVFWGVIVSPAPRLVRASFGVRLAMIAAADLVNFLLGIGLAFAAEPYYRSYAHVPRLWGLSALDDLRLGGGVMWVMGQMMYAVPVLILLAVFLRRDEAAALRAAGGRTPAAAAPGGGR